MPGRVILLRLPLGGGAGPERHGLLAVLYQGFLDRAPTGQERDDWAKYLLHTRDLQGTVEYFFKSPEYAEKRKNEQQAIRDLYEGVFGRQASADEIRVWEQRLASR